VRLTVYFIDLKVSQFFLGFACGMIFVGVILVIHSRFGLQRRRDGLK
jgi:hypothetical protein